MTPKPIPDDIAWAEELVQENLRPAAFLRPGKGSPAAQGSTRAWGLPDIPVGAAWAVPPAFEHKHWNRMPWALNQSPYDGESFYLQLNLAEIPVEVRKPEWPAHGVVWVLLDLSGEHWEAHAHFDPRPAQDIPWHPRLDDKAPEAASWTVNRVAPDCTDKVLPELAWDGRTYTDWAQDHNARASVSDVQVGGWVWPCQGWFDERNEDFVCALEQQSFGDCGAVYLHYNAERGFYALAESH